MVSIASCIVPVLLPHAAACGVDKSIAVKVLVFLPGLVPLLFMLRRVSCKARGILSIYRG